MKTPSMDSGRNGQSAAWRWAGITMFLEGALLMARVAIVLHHGGAPSMSKFVTIIPAFDVALGLILFIAPAYGRKAAIGRAWLAVLLVYLLLEAHVPELSIIQAAVAVTLGAAVLDRATFLARPVSILLVLWCCYAIPVVAKDGDPSRTVLNLFSKRRDISCHVSSCSLGWPSPSWLDRTSRLQRSGSLAQQELTLWLPDAQARIDVFSVSVKGARRPPEVVLDELLKQFEETMPTLAVIETRPSDGVTQGRLARTRYVESGQQMRGIIAAFSSEGVVYRIAASIPERSAREIEPEVMSAIDRFRLPITTSDVASNGGG